jgi:hypothetical protein
VEAKVRTAARHAVPQAYIDRFFDSVDVRGEDDCWLWLKSVGSHGYGQASWATNGKSAGTTAHRVAWMAAIGPIPDGLTVDHRCRVRRCCNPRHLRLLANVDNARDNGQGKKATCPRGHPYVGDNLYVTPRGHRRCRACAAIHRRNLLGGKQ